MITAFLLMPVVAVLLWLYWYWLPVDKERASRWRRGDTLLLVLLASLASGFVYIAKHMEYEGAGPMWPELVSAVGAYAIIAIGLTLGLVWRRSSA
jgi:hypothetical protein